MATRQQARAQQYRSTTTTAARLEQLGAIACPPPLLVDDGPSVFGDGWDTPSASGTQQGVPWASVKEVIAMARDALMAKQHVAERLAAELDALRSESNLLARATRAEVDSGSLLDELQQLMQAKAALVRQHADLDRANALLVAERQLLCEQLQVPPADNVNLVAAVSKVLAAARRAKTLEAHLRVLAKLQKQLLMQLHSQREEAACATRSWQARELAYLQLLASHGIAAPEELVHAAATCGDGAAAAAARAGVADDGQASAAAAAVGRNGSSCDVNSTASALVTQLMRMRKGGGAAEQCMEPSDSPTQQHAHMLPSTPPVHDLSQGKGGSGDPAAASANSSAACGAPLRHELDSHLSSLTGLLQQLALGHLGDSDSDEDADDGMYDCLQCDECGGSEASWHAADAMSGDSDANGSHAQDGSSSSSVLPQQLGGVGHHQMLLPAFQSPLPPLHEAAEEVAAV